MWRLPEPSGNIVIITAGEETVGVAGEMLVQYRYRD